MADNIRRFSNTDLFGFILLTFFLILNNKLYAEGVKVVDPAVTLQSQLKGNNTIFVFNTCYDLKGQTIVIPQGAVLKFEGGKLINGIIKNSSFYVEAPRIQVFENILFSTIEDTDLAQINPIRVRVLKDNSFFNIETNSIANKGDVVNSRSLYRLSNPSQTSNTRNGLRKVTFNRTDYIVSDQWNNYTYPTRQIVGIDTRNGKMLQNAIVSSQNELFYLINPIIYKDVSTLQNRDIFPEWFGCKADSDNDQSEFINYSISVASDSRSFILLSSGKYQLKKPLIATTNTKIIGVDSSPWNVCTNIAVETNTGIIIFDEKGCNNVLIEGLSFSANSKYWVERYTGIEIRTSLQGMVLKNISCFQPEIGIHLHAYSDLLSTSVENYKQLSGVYGIVMQPLFKTTFKSAYCNGNRIDIGTGGSSLMKKNALYIKNCDGNTISYSAGEQYGNPSVYCDNSIITISGITWHEESVFLQAVNHSEVTVVGEMYAMGAIVADETSLIHDSNMKDSHYRHNVINPNYHTIDLADIMLLKLDATHASFVDDDGNVLSEHGKESIKYVNGNPYCIKSSNTISDSYTIPYNNKNGATILMRVCSSGSPKKDTPYITLNGQRVFELTPSSSFPISCIVSSQNNNTVGYLIQGESIFSFCVKGDTIYRNDRVVGQINKDKKTISLNWDSKSETALMVSDILIVNKAITDDLSIREYESYLSNAKNLLLPSKGITRPKLTKSYSGYVFFDKNLGRMIVWNGEKWINTDGSLIY